MTTAATYTYLQKYSNFKSVNEMDEHVQQHIKSNKGLTKATLKVLYAIARRSLKYVGASHLKAETIAKIAGVSVKTVMRAVKKLTGLGILTKENSTKMNGIMGANIYSINLFVSVNVPAELSKRANDETPSASKVEQLQNEEESVISLSNKKSLKDISYQQAETVDSPNPIIKETVNQKPNLRTRISHQLKARGLSKSLLNEFAMIAYSNIKKVSKIDVTIPRDYLEDVAYRKFLAVIDSAKVKNAFGLFTHELKKVFSKLVGQSEEQDAVELNAKRGMLVRPVPQSIIDAETDPAKKARYIKNNKVAKEQFEAARAGVKGKKVGVVTDWLIQQKEDEAKEEAERAAAKKIEEENAPQIDFEAERKRLLAELNA